MQPAISQVCSLNSAFEQDIEDYAAGQCSVIELWLTKPEDYVENKGIEQTLGLLAAHGVVAGYHTIGEFVMINALMIQLLNH